MSDDTGIERLAAAERRLAGLVRANDHNIPAIEEEFGAVRRRCDGLELAVQECARNVRELLFVVGVLVICVAVVAALAAQHMGAQKQVPRLQAAP